MHLFRLSLHRIRIAHHTLAHIMASEKPTAAEVCPVDHKTREAWLEQARKSQSANAPPPTSPHTPLQAEGCDSSQLDQKLPTSHPGLLANSRLGTHREISTIPRALDLPEGSLAARPANNEKDTGADKKTGNWIYPSEEMFFNAMKRKSYNPDEKDMQTIVPIHNAVNERAWQEIKEWERGRGSEAYVSLVPISITVIMCIWICVLIVV